MYYYYGNPVLIALAVMPAIFLMVYIEHKDTLESESFGLLGSLVLFGILSTAGAIILEELGTFVLDCFFEYDTLPYNVLLYFVVVGGAEEGCKYLLLKKRTWNSPQFNCQFDGMLYAVFISLGFALWENISYVMMYGLGTAFIRALTAVPGHACYGVFMGFWYGIAKKYEYAGAYADSALCRKAAFLMPTLIHGTYDFIACWPTTTATVIFGIFILIMFAICVFLVNRSSRSDQYIV